MVHRGSIAFLTQLSRLRRICSIVELGPISVETNSEGVSTKCTSTAWHFTFSGAA